VQEQKHLQGKLCRPPHPSTPLNPTPGLSPGQTTNIISIFFLPNYFLLLTSKFPYHIHSFIFITLSSTYFPSLSIYFFHYIFFYSFFFHLSHYSYSLFYFSYSLILYNISLLFYSSSFIIPFLFFLFTFLNSILFPIYFSFHLSSYLSSLPTSHTIFPLHLPHHHILPFLHTLPSLPHLPSNYFFNSFFIISISFNTILLLTQHLPLNNHHY